MLKHFELDEIFNSTILDVFENLNILLLFKFVHRESVYTYNIHIVKI